MPHPDEISPETMLLKSLGSLAQDAELADIFDGEPDTGTASSVRGSIAVAALGATSQNTEPVVTVSADGMTAFLTLSPRIAPYSDAEVQVALSQAGVVHGLDPQRIESVLSAGHAQLAPVALGTPPKLGTDARIDYLFARVSDALEEHGGRVDWRTVHLVESVTVGQLLARKHPARPGEPGSDVRGRVLPAKTPKDLRVQIGPGASVDPNDPLLIVATVDGAVHVDADGRITVEDTYVVSGDVDLETGNVDFAGSVVVKGDVKKGFSLQATGDIEVRGVVEEAGIVAGGSFVATGGVFGGANPALVTAGQDIFARYANNATLRAGGDILLDQECMNCDVESERTVIVGGKVPTRGFIRGGSVRAAEKVVAHTLGSVGGGTTKVRVGIDWLIPRKLELVEAELTRRQEQFEKAQARLRELLAAAASLDADQRLVLQKVRTAHDTLNVAVRTLQAQRNRWMTRAQQKGTIEVTGVAYVGCELCVDGATRTLTDTRGGECFIEESGKVVGLPLREQR